MRTLQLDGSGNKNQDRSIQPSAIVGELGPRALAPAGPAPAPVATPRPTPAPRAPAPTPRAVAPTPRTASGGGTTTTAPLPTAPPTSIDRLAPTAADDGTRPLLVLVLLLVGGLVSAVSMWWRSPSRSRPRDR
jgi:hypothetical protein